ncbi:lactate utilization protein C [Streptantibioticus rubrisoli]|uniref:LUD domain-containing protein n=1 Tax=Streptantibioticus rubrisoli TaxID=1387313 RepID=A0ABT1PM13_9ACTN|nr:LUD domain-containing protein [Streptantibioticus rubrisoli]MCQ4045330.1 LUD domain-containing protein [Streptantibioticus rubrisoli]
MTVSSRSAAREEVLARVRSAVGDSSAVEQSYAQVPRGYRDAGGGERPWEAGAPQTVALFLERLADYGASARLVDASAAPSAIAEALAGRSASTVVVPHGFPEQWRAGLAGVRVLGDDPPVGLDALDAVDGAVTTAAIAAAATGTFVLDGGPGQGRRALTLVPDYHLCVIPADRIVRSVPQALARLDPVRPLTLVSGPSATSDIEMKRVEGVHGPRTLEVLVVAAEPPPEDHRPIDDPAES